MDDYKIALLLLVIPIVYIYLNKTTEPLHNWKYEPNAIQISYKANENLNTYNGRSHTLVLAVYQLSEPSGFKDKTKSSRGLQELLGIQHFDQTVAGIDKIIIRPEEQTTIHLDRVENAKWVGIAAGYYRLEPGDVSSCFAISSKTEKVGRLKKKKVFIIEPIHIMLHFGSHGIYKADVINGE